MTARKKEDPIGPDGMVLPEVGAWADTKYRLRRFAAEDLAKGWHGNRLRLPPEVRLPDEADLHRLDAPGSKVLDKTRPRKYHFWQPEWAAETAALAGGRDG